MKIAITGSIGSGKTTVCDYIRNKGFDVFDCDKVNSELLKKGNSGYLAIKDEFPNVINNNEIDKKALSDLIFNDNFLKKKLENILHPLILEKMYESMKNSDIFFAEVPLLFEADWDYLFDIKVLIISDVEKSFNRLKNRGIEENEASSRLNFQLSNQDKIKRADEIIYNNGSLTSLYENIDTLLDKYVR